MKYNKIFIVVLNWNGFADTADCLESLRSVRVPKPSVIMVDNGSTAPGLDDLESRFHEVSFIRLDHNHGFAGGMNQGIRVALARGADFIVLLNNDVIVDEHFLAPVIEAAESLDNFGAGSGVILNHSKGEKTDLVWYAGTKWKPIRGEGHNAKRGKRFQRNQYQKLERTDIVTGCFLSAPATTFVKCGLFDEQFYFGIEDTDYSLRLMRHGLDRYVVFDSLIWHKVGRSRLLSAQEVERAYAAKCLLMAKHKGKHSFAMWSIAYRIFINYAGAWLSGRKLARLGYCNGNASSVRLAIIRGVNSGAINKIGLEANCDVRISGKPNSR